MHWPSSATGFLEQTCAEGHSQGHSTGPQNFKQTLEEGLNTDDLVGNVNEANVQIEGILTSALLDTGSSVSTISQTFFEQNLAHLELHDTGNLLKLECADGQSLPYSGYMKVDINVPLNGKNFVSPCLLLVVSEMHYSASTPVLLGTNFLMKGMKDCSQQFGTNFLQRSVQQSSWYLALHCVALRERQLTRHCNHIAIVRSAEKNHFTIRPNEQVTVSGYVDKSQPYHQTCALLQPHPQVTADLDLNPSLISYRHQLTKPVEVSFSNLSTHTVTISPKTVLCEVQPVDITINITGGCSWQRKG